MTSFSGRIKVGCLGFPVARKKYYESLSVVEVQQTFYQLPSEETARKWKDEAPEGFEFNIKVPQLITHPANSPTYRRLKEPVPLERMKEYGYFKPTSGVMEAWRQTLETVRILDAKYLVFQCPASFRPTPENKDNLGTFFSSIERGPLRFVWEPRGNWTDEEIEEICRAHDLIHCVDPFKRKPLYGSPRYFRLLRKPGPDFHYSQEELDLLIREWAGEPVYFMFNHWTFSDAVAFREKLLDPRQAQWQAHF